MDAVTVTAEMTADEFLALGPNPGGVRQELVDGELVVSQPAWTHNDSQFQIAFALESWTRAVAERGSVGLPLDVLLDDHNVYEPDVVWYRHGRAPRRGDPIPYPVPDIAVEVRSPSTWRLDIGAKKANYERHGLPELWLVDTAAEVVLVFRRSKPDAPRFDVSLELTATDTLTSPLLPGFSLPVGEIFAA
ncbi:MAG: Uma2 family endonuclease [Solirubrobacterales bacterium]|nr:Uma2 family endonuclease [Solirubrobacterales bacterium]